MDDRKVTIYSVNVNGKSVVVKLTMEGKKMTLVSVLSLVPNKEGEWKLISETHTIMQLLKREGKSKGGLLLITPFSGPLDE